MRKCMIVPAKLAAKKNTSKLRIGVIGGSYIGVAVGVGFAEQGYDVVLVEPERDRRLKLTNNTREFLSADTVLSEVFGNVFRERFLEISANISSLKGIPYVFFCNGEDDPKQLWRAAEDALPHLSDPCCFIIKSTVPVGTGEKLQSWFEEQGKNVEVISCPSFMREGNALADFRKPSRIILGGDESKAGINSLRSILSREALPILMTTRNEAEMIKYAANSFLATKISFINQLSWLCETMDTDIVTIARAIGLDPRIGQAFLQAGIGFSGPSLAKDLAALIEQSKHVGVRTPLLEAVQEVNTTQRRWVLKQLKNKYPLLEGKTLAVWGVSFKGGSSTIQESAAIKILEQLLSSQANLKIYDPVSLPALKEKWVENGVLENFSNQIQWCSSCLDSAACAEALLILTDWQEFVETDLVALKKRMKTPMIIDGKNLFPTAMMIDWGFQYVSVGGKV
jgi:UDPglucose 6-dehydrogenase